MRWTFLELARAGYGTYAEIAALDTDELLDMVEHASIRADFDAHSLGQ